MSEPHNHEKLTGAQNEAINKAWELLREHFEAVIIAYDTEAVTGTDRHHGRGVGAGAKGDGKGEGSRMF
jgi:hypothetical protein